MPQAWSLERLMATPQLRKSQRPMNSQAPTPKTSQDKNGSVSFEIAPLGFLTWRSWELPHWSSSLGGFGSWSLGVHWALGVVKLGILSARSLHLDEASRNRELSRVGRHRSNRGDFAPDLVAGHDARAERDPQRKPSAGRQRLHAGNRRERLQRTEHRRVRAPGEGVRGPQIAAQV